MKLTDKGVDVVLSIDKSQDKIPADTLALVGNKSAVGEQYVELQPKTDTGPVPEGRARRSPRPTPRSRSRRPRSSPTSTTCVAVGAAGRAAHRGDRVRRGVQGHRARAWVRSSTPRTRSSTRPTTTSTTTTALIHDGRTVLQTQVDKGSAIRSFARDLALFSGTLADNDNDLRSLIDNGSATANELRTFLQQNQVDLGQLINNLVTTGEVIVKHLNGIRQILVIYPYVVAGGFTVAEKNSDGRTTPTSA